ncbi:MAG TPA: diaminopimelate decarboxylase [Bacteroidota bacterium]
MTHFYYKDSELYCEDVLLREIAEEYDTPLYVYSRSQILENFNSLNAALGETDHVTCYALKANSNLSILKLLAEAGAGADVVSGGELYLALKAGFPPHKITFAGVGKREDEIEYALREKIFSLSVESVQELQLVSTVANRMNTTAQVAIRVNPDIDAESHPYITTGLKQNKFGIEAGKIEETFKIASSLPSLAVHGIHTHIGSQITKAEPFQSAAKFVVEWVAKLRANGFGITTIDFGGGIGVAYANTIKHEALPVDDVADNYVSPAHQLISEVVPILQQAGCSLWIEPGRSIVADAGVLLTKILYTKENSGRKFIIVDSGMTELLRPSLYGAYHQIVPVTIDTFVQEKVDVVGPICESGDFLAKDRMLPKAKQNSYLAVLTTGAYGFVFSSNYNARLHPAEILVNGERVRVIRQRQTLEQLL